MCRTRLKKFCRLTCCAYSSLLYAWKYLSFLSRSGRTFRERKWCSGKWPFRPIASFVLLCSKHAKRNRSLQTKEQKDTSFPNFQSPIPNLLKTINLFRNGWKEKGKTERKRERESRFFLSFSRQFLQIFLLDLLSIQHFLRIAERENSSSSFFKRNKIKKKKKKKKKKKRKFTRPRLLFFSVPRLGDTVH